MFGISSDFKTPCSMEGYEKFSQVDQNLWNISNFFLSPLKKNYLFYYLFYLRERDREHEQGRGAEGEREDPKQAPYSAQSLMWGSIPQLWDHDLS